LNDWFSVQGNYIGNRNRLQWTYVGDNLRVTLPYRTAQHAGVADLLLYFRERRDWVRPYLSAGIGAVHTRADLHATQLDTRETSTDAVMRVAVGVDVLLKDNLRFRYSFSESLSRNPFAGPVPAKKAFMNFQNLFGAVWYF
jgi:opacity protein-like surface antigen